MTEQELIDMLGNVIDESKFKELLEEEERIYVYHGILEEVHITCRACGKMFKNRKDLHFHHKKMFEIYKTFPLSFITEYTARRNDMWKSYEKGIFTCKSCKKSFKTLKELSVHRAKIPLQNII